jgi:hypothetical protein
MCGGINVQNIAIGGTIQRPTPIHDTREFRELALGRDSVSTLPSGVSMSRAASRATRGVIVTRMPSLAVRW